MNMRLLYTVPEDYPQRWHEWTRRFRGRGSVKRVKRLRIAGNVLVALYVLTYLLLGWVSLTSWPGAGFGYFLSTAVCFGLLSLYRNRRNEPRPYEVFDMKPLVPKKDRSSGRSFPSRHTFCAFLIATMVFAIFRSFIGVIALLLATALAWIRVIEGKHFPRDVFVGALLGIISGLICTAAIIVAF